MLALAEFQQKRIPQSDPGGLLSPNPNFVLASKIVDKAKHEFSAEESKRFVHHL